MSRTRWACIMAGGVGKRFWPLSRRARPKHLIPVVGDQSLLRQTAERLSRIVGWDRLLVVTSEVQADAVHVELPEVARSFILGEPSGRNTAACVGLALRWLILRGEEDSLVGFFPSDHVVGDPARFAACLERGWALADGGKIVAFGIAPVSAETGYGYIREGDPLDALTPRAFLVRSFHEKPDRSRAQEWVASGEYLWNSGMFVSRVGVLWDELARYLPGITRGIESLGDIRDEGVLRRGRDVYEGLQSVSIDQGVMEKTQRLAVVESAFGWDDVGSWEAASEYWPLHEDNRILGSPVALVDCHGCRVHAQGMLVAMVGLEDVVLVQTEDAILVCHRSRVQDVKALVERLEAEGAVTYL